MTQRKRKIRKMGIKKERHIFIGDIHGCLEEFEELLLKVQYNPQKDDVILVGDLMDRGPDSVGVVRKVRELDLKWVLGNHDRKFIKWFNGNKHLDAFKHYKEFSNDDIDFIFRAPYYLKLADDLWVIHAGVKPGLTLENQKRDDLIYLRYTDADRKFISIHKIVSGQAPGAMFWTEFGPFGANIVYGHEVHSLEDVRIDTFADGTACYGLDTGCCFGGRLSALIWENKEIVQVQAKKEYSNFFSREKKD
jgi:bis(5'-nucleosyl)-tetraphosphatase (symmetrical)